MSAIDEREVDVVVVGGGPGGSTASTLLTKSGHEVMMLERVHHPRYQIGESLLPSTIHGITRLLDVFDEVHEANFVRKPGGTFRWGEREDPWSFKFTTMTEGRADYAFHVRRAQFDKLLFDNARRHGVDAHEGIEVMEPISEDGRVCGVVARDHDGRQMRVHARYVIDASGHGSRLARHVGARIYSDFFQNVAVFGYYRGATRQPEPNAGNQMITAFESGWCWFIPISDELTSIGAVVDRSQLGRIRADRGEALHWFVQQCPNIYHHLKPAERVSEGLYGEVRLRKDWSYTTDAFTAPGILLAGDAACFIDPVWSSGVHLATYGGLLAARTVATVFAGDLDEATCVREFEQRLRREFRVWYEFVLGFYDMSQNWDSYFWQARTLVGIQERPSLAFLRLIAGGGTASEEFFAQRAGSGKSFSQLIATAADQPSGAPGRLPEKISESGPDMSKRFRDRIHEMLNVMSVDGPDAPVFPDDGLVATNDRLRWMRASQSGT